MSTIPTYGPVNPLSLAADAGAFPPGAGVNPSTLQSLYAQLGGTGTADLTTAGAGAGRLSSLLGRFTPAAGEATPLIEGGLLRGGARASVPFFAGQLATAGINNALPSTGKSGDIRQVLGDAATGAGIGGTAGLLGGPFAEVTVPVGAAVGGIAGGLYGGLNALFGGQDDGGDSTNDKYKTTLLTAASQLGLDPKQYSAAWDLLTQSGADPKQLSVQLSQQLLQDAAVTKQRNEALAQAAQQRQVDQRFALAIQSQAAEFFAPYTNNIVNAGATQAELLTHLADQLPPAYKNVMLNQAQQSIGQATRLAGAYAAQSALIPGQFMAQAESKRQAEIQRLQYQQAVIQSQQGGGGGAAYDQLAQQLAGAGAGAQVQQPLVGATG